MVIFSAWFVSKQTYTQPFSKQITQPFLTQFELKNNKISDQNDIFGDFQIL